MSTEWQRADADAAHHGYRIHSAGDSFFTKQVKLFNCVAKTVELIPQS
jgi:hypothetical protein